MVSKIWNDQSFFVTNADGSGTKNNTFESGLRAFFEYKDLGVNKATNGKYGANIIRAIPGKKSEAKWHTHELDFQFVFILNGWVKFQYESYGEITMRKGSSVIQPPGIKHREISHSDDLELIEITSPAEFKTNSVKK